jgi:hypothetical protein
MIAAGRLCVCLTPLHVLIARRIAGTEGRRFPVGLFVTSVDNDKQRHYAERMRAFCDTVEYRVLPGEDSYRGPKLPAIWLRRLKYRFLLRRAGRFSTVYVPSSNNHYVYILLAAIHFDELVSYDDGLLNINPDSPLFQAPTRWRARMFLRLAGVGYWPERIRERATRHYSIYDARNICGRVSRLGLIEGADGQGQGGGAVDRILLGPAPEAAAEVFDALRRAAARFSVRRYLPHPRETRPAFDGLECVQTALVAEDYILGRLEADPALRFEVYGYDSAALVNLAAVPRVRAFSLLPASTPGARPLGGLMRNCGVALVA